MNLIEKTIFEMNQCVIEDNYADFMSYHNSSFSYLDKDILTLKSAYKPYELINADNAIGDLIDDLIYQIELDLDNGKLSVTGYKIKITPEVFYKILNLIGDFTADNNMNGERNNYLDHIMSQYPYTFPSHLLLVLIYSVLKNKGYDEKDFNIHINYNSVDVDRTKYATIVKTKYGEFIKVPDIDLTFYYNLNIKLFKDEDIEGIKNDYTNIIKNLSNINSPNEGVKNE